VKLKNQLMFFDKRYFGVAVLIFFVEMLIALFVDDNFVRPYLGDVLVVILIYCFIRSFVKIETRSAVAFVLLFSFTIELLQYLNVIETLGLQNSAIARTVIGTSFSWLELLCYAIGMAIVVIVEYNRKDVERSYPSEE
jgi:hypothetical protein